MAAVANEVMPAGREGRVQIEAVHASAGTRARLRAEFIEADQNRGPVVMLGQPTGDDADYAGVPAAGGKYKSRGLGWIAGFLRQFVRGFIHAAFERLTLLVETMNEFRELLRPLGALGHQELQREGRLPQPAGGVE